MSQSLDQVLLHFVTSTKHRTPLITPTVRPHLHAYLVGILQKIGCPSLQTGGVEDHIHILFSLGRTLPVCEVVEEIKKSSSKWMKTQGIPTFSWQSGYGIFSVAESQTAHVVNYIQNQEKHHQKISFQDEYRYILNHRKIAFDERYVWD